MSTSLLMALQSIHDAETAVISLSLGKLTRDRVDLSVLSRVLRALFTSTNVFGVNDCDAATSRVILSALASSTSVVEADLGLVTEGSSEELLASWRVLHEELLAPTHSFHSITTLKLDTGALYRGDVPNIVDELSRERRSTRTSETTEVVASQNTGIQIRTLEIDGFPELHDVELGETPPERRIPIDCSAIASLVQSIGTRLVSLRVSMPSDRRLPTSVVDSIVISCGSLKRLDLSGAELSSLTRLLESCEHERSKLSHLVLSDVVLRDPQSVHALVAALRARRCTRIARRLRSLTLWPVAPDDCGVASPVDQRDFLNECLAMLQLNNRLQRLQLGIHDAALYDEYRPLFERHHNERIVGESALDRRQTAALLSVFLCTRQDAVARTTAHKLQRLQPPQHHRHSSSTGAFVRSIVTRIVDFAAEPSTRSIEF